MARPALAAHAFLACGNVQWDGPAGPTTTRTLERVGYTYRTDTSDGFPHEAEFWLFVRLAHNAVREFTTELRLTLLWHDDPQLRSELWTRHFQTVTFRPAVLVRDFAVPVPLTFEGAGRHEFRLWYPVVRKWDRSRRRRTLARTHLRIEG